MKTLEDIVDALDEIERTRSLLEEARNYNDGASAAYYLNDLRKKLENLRHQTSLLSAKGEAIPCN